MRALSNYFTQISNSSWTLHVCFAKGHPSYGTLRLNFEPVKDQDKQTAKWP
jgi:hypothetical protein